MIFRLPSALMKIYEGTSDIDGFNSLKAFVHDCKILQSYPSSKHFPSFDLANIYSFSETWGYSNIAYTLNDVEQKLLNVCDYTLTMFVR